MELAMMETRIWQMDVQQIKSWNAGNVVINSV